MSTCKYIDIEILPDSDILNLINSEFIPFGLSVHTLHGKQISRQIEAKCVPHVSLIRLKDDAPVLISVLEGKEEITIESLMQELTKAVEDYNNEKQEQVQQIEEAK
jgi:hypothetical protein